MGEPTSLYPMYLSLACSDSLLDELSSYENDHSDSLAPIQNHPELSFDGDHTLTAPRYCRRDEGIQVIQLVLTGWQLTLVVNSS